MLSEMQNISKVYWTNSVILRENEIWNMYLKNSTNSGYD